MYSLEALPSYIHNLEQCFYLGCIDSKTNSFMWKTRNWGLYRAISDTI